MNIRREIRHVDLTSIVGVRVGRFSVKLKIIPMAHIEAGIGSNCPPFQNILSKSHAQLAIELADGSLNRFFSGSHLHIKEFGYGHRRKYPQDHQHGNDFNQGKTFLALRQSIVSFGAHLSPQLCSRS